MRLKIRDTLREELAKALNDLEFKTISWEDASPGWHNECMRLVDALMPIITARESAARAEHREPTGSMECPICGQDSPHAHSDSSIVAWLNDQGSRFGVSVVNRKLTITERTEESAHKMAEAVVYHFMGRTLSNQQQFRANSQIREAKEVLVSILRSEVISREDAINGEIAERENVAYEKGKVALHEDAERIAYLKGQAWEHEAYCTVRGCKEYPCPRRMEIEYELSTARETKTSLYSDI